jgi:hypothetical protein
VDAFIAADAREALVALNALAPGKKLLGVLIGHKRGHRFVVERIFPAPPGFGLDERNMLRADDAFAGRAVGFYASGNIARLKAALRGPAAAGRLLLSVRTAKRGPALKAYAVDFDGRCRFVPLPLIIEGDEP